MKAFVSKYENTALVSATEFSLEVSVTYFTDTGEKINIVARVVLALNATIDQMRVAIAQAVVDSCDPSWGGITKDSVILPAFVSGA